jgi:N-glycosylase/DNA lyase
MKFCVPRFDYRKLIRAHGWIFLAPFRWDDDRNRMGRPLVAVDPVDVEIAVRRAGPAMHIRAVPDRRLDRAEQAAVRSQVRRMLCLDQDFSEFHALCSADPVLKFVSRQRCGGMLRSPTAFEDLVKTICTINCDWRNTTRMCEALCSLDSGGFPSPDVLLRYSTRQLARKTPVGYRARTIRAVAKLTAESKLPLDEWAGSSDFATIRERLTAIWGLGPYSVAHMLVMLGDYGEIPVDSEVLSYLRETHFRSRHVTAKEAVKPYERYGKFRFLAFKFGRMARRLNYINK